MVHEILKSMHAVGKGNAVSRKTLAALTGLSDRSMRSEIEKERRSGILICSHMETGGGYYLPADEMEIREYYNAQTSRISSLILAREPFKRALQGDGYGG